MINLRLCEPKSFNGLSQITNNRWPICFWSFLLINSLFHYLITNTYLMTILATSYLSVTTAAALLAHVAVTVMVRWPSKQGCNYTFEPGFSKLSIISISQDSLSSTESWLSSSYNAICKRIERNSFALYGVNWWRCGVVVITTAQLHSTTPELRFCAGSNPARSVSEIRDGEDLWQFSLLEIRLITFRRSTIPQKQLIIINFSKIRCPSLLVSLRLL